MAETRVENSDGGANTGWHPNSSKYVFFAFV